MRFDTTKNALFSLLRIAGLSFAALILLALILAPFADTEIDDAKNEIAEEKQNPSLEQTETRNTQQAFVDSGAEPTNTETEQGDMATEASSGNAVNAQNTEVEQNSTASNAAAGADSLYKVVKVVDGDTIDVSIDGKTERIRVIGLDTPETVDPRQPVECFGLEASAKAKELLLNKQVRLEADATQGERDTYGRLLRYVFLADGRNYGLEMISQGYGHEHTYRVPHKYQQSFQRAENEASNAQHGLWAPGACRQEAEASESNDDASGGCHSAYEPCLPIVNDLNCSDVDGPITVKDPGVDPYGLDGDGDGVGCES